MAATEPPVSSGRIWRICESLAWLEEVKDAILAFWQARQDLQEDLAKTHRAGVQEAYLTSVVVWKAIEASRSRGSGDLAPLRALVQAAQVRVDQAVGGLLGLDDPQAADLAVALREVFEACQSRIDQELGKSPSGQSRV